MRKTRAKSRPILPDPKFHNVDVTRFVNNLMFDGKKSIAYGVFYSAMDIIQDRLKEENALEVWKKAVENVTPQVEVRSRRVGGATFQIPQQIRDERKTSMAVKWMIGYARKRNEKTMADKLAGEIIAAFKEEGASHKKKEDTHRMADANKAFSHFRF